MIQDNIIHFNDSWYILEMPELFSNFMEALLTLLQRSLEICFPPQRKLILQFTIPSNWSTHCDFKALQSFITTGEFLKQMFYRNHYCYQNNMNILTMYRSLWNDEEQYISHSLVASISGTKQLFSVSSKWCIICAESIITVLSMCNKRPRLSTATLDQWLEGVSVDTQRYVVQSSCRNPKCPRFL